MTNEEAIEILKNNTNLGYGIIIEGESVKMIYDALEMAITALKKQTQKEPIEYWDESYSYDHCPYCGVQVIIDEDDFCPKCGQALDWKS